MTGRRRVLVLAGTAEARAVLARAAGLDVLASLAGRTAQPDLPVPVRIGGFGGDAGFASALPSFAAVLDATHPFATRISARTARLCTAAGTPYLRLTRAPWPVQDDWAVHGDAAAAARALPGDARVLLTVGPGSLAPFLGRGASLWCRRVDSAPPKDGVHWIVGRPGDAQTEARLLRSLRISDLVSKNAGGAGRGKLDAARDLGVRVHMIARPPAPPGQETHDADAAFAFIAAHADRRDPG